MGPHIANELLLVGQTIPARRLQQVGFLEILNTDSQLDFLNAVLAKATVMASYSSDVVSLTRNHLIKTPEERQLRSRVNHLELTHIRKLMMADSSRKPIQAFVDARAAKRALKSKI
jgi:hypothetical protein